MNNDGGGDRGPSFNLVLIEQDNNNDYRMVTEIVQAIKRKNILFLKAMLQVELK